MYYIFANFYIFSFLQRVEMFLRDEKKHKKNLWDNELGKRHYGEVRGKKQEARDIIMIRLYLSARVFLVP